MRKRTIITIIVVILALLIIATLVLNAMIKVNRNYCKVDDVVYANSEPNDTSEAGEYASFTSPLEEEGGNVFDGPDSNPLLG